MTERSPRRSAETLAEVIRDAVRCELLRAGYRGVTFEGVAKRARTNKPVLYRRFHSRARMVFDAVRPPTSPLVPGPLPGSLRADLAIVLRAAGDRFSAIGPQTYHGLLAEADDELMRDVVALTDDVGRELARTVIAAARDRGEIGEQPVPERVASLPIVLLRDHYFFSDAREDVVDDLLDSVYLPLLQAVTSWKNPSPASLSEALTCQYCG